MTRTLVSKLGRPNIAAKPRLCPVCAATKTATHFRQSNRNPKLNIICWQCRKDNPRAETEFYKVPTRRQNSKFRQTFWAINGLLERKFTKKEVKRLGAKHVKNQAAQLLRFPERVAAIIGKTYAVRGDDYTLSDDEANTRIRDLLEELDPTLVERNKNKRLSR